MCKVLIKGKVEHIKFDNTFLFRTWYYSVINIYPRNVEALKKKDKIKKNLEYWELDAFIALLYASGAYQAKICGIKFGDLLFFLKTMSRNDFVEVMRFIRFDKKRPTFTSQ